MTATAERRWLRGNGGLVLHVLVVAFIVATQILYTPARDLGPDNTWHYRLAHDIVTGVPVYWAGLDGNRLFPDLLFSIAAFVLSGRAQFEGWLPYFYVLFFLTTYLSLIALAATLYDEVIERRAFVLLAVAGFWAFELAAPFWPRWFFDPGNHGTGLPVAIACLALAFYMNRNRRFDWLAAVVFVLAASLLVGSNRFLFIAFLGPLLLALIGLLVAQTAARRVEQRNAVLTLPPRRRTPLPALVLMTGVAIIGSYLAYRTLSTLSWHKATTFMGISFLDRDLSLEWAVEKLGREVDDFRGFFVTMNKQVAVGPALLFVTVIVSLVRLVSMVRRGSVQPLEGNRVALGLLAAGSAVLSIAFVVWGWDEKTEWRYRYLAMATAFAVVFLATLLVRPAVSLPRPGWVGAGLLLALAALTVIPATGDYARGRAERQRKFTREIDEVKRWVAANTRATPLKGLGEYWVAMDITSRTDLRIDLLNEEAQARLYNSNAGALCFGGHSFILRKIGPDAPRRQDIVALLGEPQATKGMTIEGHEEVEILVYDPAIIQSRIVDEGRKEAPRLWPNFKCPP